MPRIDLAHSDARVARHGRMHRVVAQHGAVHTVIGIGRNGPDHVGGVNVFHCEGQLNLLEAFHDLVAKPWPHVGQLFVATTVDLPRALQQGVATPFRHHHQAVALGLHQLQNVPQDLLQADLHLRQHHDVRVARRQARVQGDEARVPPHQLHQAHAVGVAGRLHVSGLDGALCFHTRRVEAEGAVEHRDVVVDGLGDPHHRAVPVLRHHEVGALVGAPVRAVPADDEMRAHPHVHQHLHLLLLCGVAPIADQNGPAHRVDVLHIVGRQLHPHLRLDNSLVASTDAIDLVHPVLCQHHHQLANHRVQARAQAPASYHRRDHVLRREMQRRPCPSQRHLIDALGAAQSNGLGRIRVLRNKAADDVSQWRLHILRQKRLGEALDPQAPQLAAGGEDVFGLQLPEGEQVAVIVLHHEGGLIESLLARHQARGLLLHHGAPLVAHSR
mmetsp:Transcript_133087/g.315489  ORF Transcript_133087/g.315489 Transcript_133087/m.315489 type:complete len:442 (+) Transcript_133087:641-1966(+)